MFALNLPTENLLYLVLYLGTLLLHVIAMHYVLGGALFVAGTELFRAVREPCDATRSILAVLRDWLPLALGVTITLGVAPILFVQLLYKQEFYTANLLLLHRWMAILPVLIVAFYLLYLQKSAWLPDRGWLRAGVATGVLLAFLFVAWSWTENHLLSIAGQQTWTEHYAAGRSFHSTGELLPRLLLWIAGAFPTLAVIVGWQLRGQMTKVLVRRLTLLGCGGGIATLILALVYAAKLPGDVREQIAYSPVAYVCTAALITSAIAWGLMGRSGQLAPHRLKLATAATFVALGCGTVLRETRRQLALEATGQLQAAMGANAESGHTGGLVVFLVFLVLNAAAIAWIIWLVRQRVAANK